MMNVYVESVIVLAMAFVDYCEKTNNAFLLDFLRNAGSGNYTRFGAELDAVGFYNGPKNGHEWCTQFIGWLFWMASGRDIEKTKKVLRIPLQGENLAAGCEYIRAYFRSAGAYDATPCIGDLVLFTTTRGSVNADHVGLLTDIGSDGTIYTIEGNKDNKVTECKYPRDYWKILGYCHPAYDNIDQDLKDLEKDYAELLQIKAEQEERLANLEERMAIIKKAVA